jgi:hypothetical protein
MKDKIVAEQDIYPQSTKSLKIFKFTPWGVTKFLLANLIILLVAHIATLFLVSIIKGEPRLTGILLRFFHLNKEANFPTLFNAFLLLFASALLFYIYKVTVGTAKAKDGKFWLLLSLILAFLCFDEAIVIHEELMYTFRDMLPNDASGFLYYAWVIPYAILFLAAAVFFMRFVLSLPIRTRNLFIISGFVYVFAAIGLELFEGYFFKLYGEYHITNEILYIIEEVLEMLALINLIYALLDYLAPYNTAIIIAPDNN